MKRLLALTLVTTLVSGIFLGTTVQKAFAACAANTANLGQVTGSFSIPTSGTYRVWSRIQPDNITNASNSFTLEIDDSTCNITVGDAAVAAGQWTWVDYRDGNANSKLNMTLSAGTHTFKAYGRESGVLLDKLVFSGDPNCLPTGLGDNCAVPPSVTPPADTIAPLVTITAPIDGQSVSGPLLIDVTATDNVAVTKVEISVDGTLKSTLTAAPYNSTIDSNALTNSGHDISVKAYDAANNSTTKTNHITVQNGDLQKPSAPVNLTANALTYDKVNLTWGASTDNVAVTGYRVVRNGTVITNLSTVTTYSDISTLPSTFYAYQVLALDAAGNISDPSGQSNVTTPAVPDTDAPSAPSNLSATAVSSSQINLSWNPSIDNVGVSGYEVYRGSTKIATVTSTSFGDAGLAANTGYNYFVRAKDNAGNVGPQSNTVSATTMVATNSNGALSGRVTGEGVVLPKATVSFLVGNKKRSFTTTSAGEYNFTNVPAGLYSVKYASKSYITKTANVTIVSGITTVQNTNLDRR